MTETIRQVTIRGRVQGVGYRAWLEFTAASLGLAGWVRNRRDGSVEALLAGPPTAVESMIAACHRGPRHAKVEGVTVEEAGAEADGVVGFGQRETL